MLEPQCNNEAAALRESGRQFYDVKYKGHFDNLFNAAGNWFRALGEDPLNKRFGQDWARLTKDLLFDSEGSLKFKPELWMDIRKVILPSIIKQVNVGTGLMAVFDARDGGISSCGGGACCGVDERGSWMGLWGCPGKALEGRGRDNYAQMRCLVPIPSTG